MPDSSSPSPSHEMVLQLVEAHPDAVLVVAGGQVLYVNHAAEQLFGHSREQLLSEPLAFAVHEEVSEIELFSRDGQRRTAEMRLSSVRWFEQPAQLVAIRDISHLKAVEADLRGTVSLLKEANHRLDTFVYASAHDLRAPMDGIGKLCWMIEEDHPALDAKLAEDLRLIRQRALRMGALIDGLQRYVTVNPVHEALGSVDVAAMARSCWDSLNAEPMRLEVEGGAESAFTFPTLLRTVLLVLLSNALKHHPTGQGVARMTTRRTDDLLHFTVDDDGQGIPPAHRDYVFEVFKTLRPRDEVEGAGVGLSIAKRITDQLGGSIVLGDSPLGGLRVNVEWPLSAPPSPVL